MTQQILDIYTIDSLQPMSQFSIEHISWLSHNNDSFILPMSPIASNITNIQVQSYWRPSDALQKTLRKLYEEDYAQFPCVPCSYRSRLLYPHSVKWVIKNDNFIYPLQSSFPQLNVITNPRNESKIAVCDGCKSNHNNRLCYVLAEIPQCIHDVPYAKRKYLSPVYLPTSFRSF